MVVGYDFYIYVIDGKILVGLWILIVILLGKVLLDYFIIYLKLNDLLKFILKM